MTADLARRLARADAELCVLRRATRDLAAAGRIARARRQDPDEPRTAAWPWPRSASAVKQEDPDVAVLSANAVEHHVNLRRRIDRASDARIPCSLILIS